MFRKITGLVSRFLGRLVRDEAGTPSVEKPLPQELASLDPIRLRILNCSVVSFNSEEAVAAAADLERFWRTRLDEVETDDFNGSHNLARQIFAAGLLTFGHLDMADVILDNMQGLSNGRATGYCVALGSSILSCCLPLPKQLKSSLRTVVNERAVRRWLAEHRERLKWDPERRKFVL